MCASFSVVWKNARAKVLYTAGESLVRTAAVKIAMIMCGDAVANKLGIFSFVKPHHQAAYRRALSRYFATNF